MLAEANANAKLDADNISAESLTEKYTSGAESPSVDAELEALKASLGMTEQA